MSDIVETLRVAAQHPYNGHGPKHWLNEAADEIEYLRATLREIVTITDRKHEAWDRAKLLLGGFCE